MVSEEEGMTEAKLPVFRTAFISWRDGLAALRSMPAMAAIVFVVMTVDTAMNEALRQAATAETILPLQLLRLSISIFLLSCFLTPAAIAINRYVQLGETARSYLLDISSPRFRRLFCAYSALINLLVLPSLTLAGGDHGYLYRRRAGRPSQSSRYSFSFSPGSCFPPLRSTRPEPVLATR